MGIEPQAQIKELTSQHVAVDVLEQIEESIKDELQYAQNIRNGTHFGTYSDAQKERELHFSEGIVWGLRRARRRLRFALKQSSIYEEASE